LREPANSRERADRQRALTSGELPSRRAGAERCLPAPEQAIRLSGVLERIRRQRAHETKPPLVVFDLDGTLIDNRPRSTVIMQELGAVWQTRFPEHSELLRNAHPDGIGYLFRENLRTFGVCDNDQLAEAIEFWKARFFSDRFLCHDRATPGAVEFARACYEARATLVYLTGRDLPNMALGSLSSLRDLGFPIGVSGTEFVMKPDPEMSDEAFKRNVMPELGRSGEVVAAFDNEPGHCNAFVACFAEAAVFLLDTQHLPGAPPLDPSVTVIATFCR